MKQVSNLLLVFLSTSLFTSIFISGCATEPKNRAASEFLLTTDKATSMLFSDIKTMLDEHKYSVQRQDVTAGILLLAPRNFVYSNGPKKTLARQNVQMRQEGGSVKVRITYECNYAGDRKEFVPCLDGDGAIATKISRIETSLIEVIQPAMLRHSSDQIEARTSEPKPEETDAKPAADSKPTENRSPASSSKPDDSLFDAH